MIIEELIAEFTRRQVAYNGFMMNVVSFFDTKNSLLTTGEGRHVIHSVRYRQKSNESLAEKIKRKIADGRELGKDNILEHIHDFCGVRAIHIRQSDFSVIHRAILSHVDDGSWVLAENPKAYTWDPENRSFFDGMGIRTELKESFYTSVHYVVKPNESQPVCCEIQVRTLLEEAWGEVDHDLNYPVPVSNLACASQLKVLAKLLGAGTRLIDSIYVSNEPQ